MLAAPDAENQSPVAPTLEDWRLSHLAACLNQVALRAFVGAREETGGCAGEDCAASCRATWLLTKKRSLLRCSPRTSRSPSPQGTPELKAERVPEPFTSPLLRRCSMLHGAVSQRLSRSPSPVPRSPSPELPPRPLVWQAPQAPQPAFVFGQPQAGTGKVSRCIEYVSNSHV